MPQGTLSFPGVTVTGQARTANLQGAKFNDFRAWVIAAKEEGVTDAGLSTYITKKLTDFESDALNHPGLKQAMGVMGVSSLEGATITGTFSQNITAGAPAASAGDVDVETGADGTTDGTTEETPTEAFDVAAEMSRLYEDMDQIRSDRRVRQAELAEKAKQVRLASERRERERYEADRIDQPSIRADREDRSAIVSQPDVRSDRPGSGYVDRIDQPSVRADLDVRADRPGSQYVDRIDQPSTAITASPTPRSAKRYTGSDFSYEDDEMFGFFAGGGMTRGNQLEVVGEEGPELVDLPPGTHVIPFQQLNRRQLRQLQRDGVPGYAGGGVVFGSETLPLGLRQLQAGRQITPSRGYLSQQAGLTIPSVQAFQNLTPESRDIFRDTAMQAGIPARAFEQELALARPGGARLPLARFQPTTRRGIR